VLLGEGLGTRHDGTFLWRENLVQHRFQIHDWTFYATAG
jgi:hypothetical protein